jgi:uncharacterized protein with LGFP repeats
MLLITFVVTVVAAAWVVGSTPKRATPGPPAASDTQLTEQPLIGLGAGVTVRELTQHSPFSLIAMTGDLAGTSTKVRAKRPDGSWGPWYQTEYETEEPDPVRAAPVAPTAEPHSTGPVFVGATTAVQVAVTRPINAQVTQPPAVAPPSGAPGKDSLGYRPASKGQPLAQNISAVLISPPQEPPQKHWTPPSGVIMPGQAPSIIGREEWGADPALRCGTPNYHSGVRAAVVHHTAGSNDYLPQDSAGIVKSIYMYHTRTLGWCDIAYNALVDKYGQVFEGSAGGVNKPVMGSHTGGFNRNTWGVAMLGDFDEVPPTPIQLRMVGQLIGWRLATDGVDPKGTVTLQSAGGHFTNFPAGAIATLPTIFTHRDVGNTDCPGNAAYARMDDIRDIASHFNDPPEELINALKGGAIYERWQAMGDMKSYLGAPTSPEDNAEGDARYATFARGAMYWSPDIGTQPITGAIFDAWASQGYERGPLGLPTSAEIQEPLRITQNFAHGTINFDRLTGNITEVVDGITAPLSPQGPTGPTVPAEHFSLPGRAVSN